MTPWYGGVYEKMVGIVKKCINKMLRPYITSYPVLETTFCAVENIVNNRPLTYVSSTDTVEALTPNHFLRLRITNVSSELELDHNQVQTKGSHLIQGYVAAKQLIEIFRVTSHQLYFTALREVHVKHHIDLSVVQ